MNEGLDLMGNPVGEKTNFLIACACNPVADDMDREIARLERKVAEGAHVAFTQPLFEVDALDRFFERTAHIPIKIMLGVIPLRTDASCRVPAPRSSRHEDPGADPATDAGRRMLQPKDVTIAVEFLESIQEMQDRIAGIYIMPPGKRFDVITEILERLAISH